jgi:hypothetical protein
MPRCERTQPTPWSGGGRWGGRDGTTQPREFVGRVRPSLETRAPREPSVSLFNFPRSLVARRPAFLFSLSSRSPLGFSGCRGKSANGFSTIRPSARLERSLPAWIDRLLESRYSSCARYSLRLRLSFSLGHLIYRSWTIKWRPKDRIYRPISPSLPIESTLFQSSCNYAPRD